MREQMWRALWWCGVLAKSHAFVNKTVATVYVNLLHPLRSSLSRFFLYSQLFLVKGWALFFKQVPYPAVTIISEASLHFSWWGFWKPNILGIANWFDFMNWLKLAGEPYVYKSYRLPPKLSGEKMGSSNDVYKEQHECVFRLRSSQSSCFPKESTRPRDVELLAPGHILSDWAKTGLLLNLIKFSFFSHTMKSHKEIGRGLQGHLKVLNVILLIPTNASTALGRVL